MDIYKNDNVNLNDSDPSVKLIRRISDLIDIMSSRTPTDKVLRKGSKEEQVKKFIILTKAFNIPSVSYSLSRTSWYISVNGKRMQMPIIFISCQIVHTLG